MAAPMNPHGPYASSLTLRPSVQDQDTLITFTYRIPPNYNPCNLPLAIELPTGPIYPTQVTSNQPSSSEHGYDALDNASCTALFGSVSQESPTPTPFTPPFTPPFASYDIDFNDIDFNDMTWADQDVLLGGEFGDSYPQLLVESETASPQSHDMTIPELHNTDAISSPLIPSDLGHDFSVPDWLASLDIRTPSTLPVHTESLPWDSFIMDGPANFFNDAYTIDPLNAVPLSPTIDSPTTTSVQTTASSPVATKFPGLSSAQYPCAEPGCLRTFSSAGHLKKHRRIHNAAFQCPLCGKAHIDNRARNRHLWTKHREYASQYEVKSEKTKCPHCLYEGRNDNVIRHITMKHSDRKKGQAGGR